MTDTWAAKVLADVPRHSLDFCDRMEIDKDGVWMHVDDAIAAIDKLGAGDGLVERLLSVSIDMGEIPSTTTLPSEVIREAAARIAALTAQNREMALDVLASSGQAQEAYAAQIAAEAERDYTHGTNEVLRAENQRIEAERDALRAQVARLEGALTDMPKAVLRTTVCQGPQWPDDRPGVWLAALEACAKSVQEAVDAALTDGGKDG